MSVAQANKDRSSRKKGALSKARIIETAVKLADESGVDALTIRQLASELKVKPMTIYYYVANKEAIIDGMVDQVFSEIELPSSNVNWKTAMHKRCSSARTVLAQHSWAISLIESRRSPGPASLRHHDEVLGCLRRAGFSVKMTAHAYALIDAFVYGFAIQETTLPATSGEEMEELVEQVFDEMPADQYPYLAEFTNKHVLKPGYDFGKEFEYGLKFVLDGLAQWLK